jgi:hypothetical protein
MQSMRGFENCGYESKSHDGHRVAFFTSAHCSFPAIVVNALHEYIDGYRRHSLLICILKSKAWKAKEVMGPSSNL